MNRYTLTFALAVVAVAASFASDAESFADDEAWLDELLGVETGAEFSLAEAEQSVEEARALLAAMKSLTEWTSECVLASGLGWRENVLLEAEGEVDSGYLQLEADYFAMRPGVGPRTELIALVYGEFRYFYDVPGLDDESMLLAQLSASRSFGEVWKGSARFEGARTEQAYDESINEFETTAITVRLWQPRLELAAERTFENGGALTLAAYAGEAAYDLGSEDFDQRGLVAGYGRRWTGGHAARFEAELYEEDYASRRSRLSTGTLAAPSLLEISGGRVSGEWTRSSDAGLARKWRTRLEYEREDDREGDYFDRESWQARQSVELVWEGWELMLEASYGKLDYAARRSDREVDAAPRSDAFWRWSAELRRPFGERFSAFAKAEGAEKDSNAEALSFAASGLFLGLSFSGRERQ